MEILSEKVNEVLDKYINKPNIFFRVYYGFYRDLETTPISVTKNLDKGKSRFLELLTEAKDNYEADFAEIYLYKLADKHPQKTSFTKTTIKFIENKKEANSEEGLQGLDYFGGFNGILQTTVQSASLKTENESLKEQKTELKTELEKIKTQNEQFVKDNFNNEDKIRKLEWDLRREKEQRENDKENAKNRLKNIDTYLPTLGGIVANIAKIDANQMRSLLGIEPEQEAVPENTEQQNTEQEQVEYEQVQKYEGEKLQAKNLIDAVNKWLMNVLDNNTGELALNTIAEVYKVFDFIAKNTDNLQLLTDLIKENNPINKN